MIWSACQHFRKLTMKQINETKPILVLEIERPIDQVHEAKENEAAPCAPLRAEEAEALPKAAFH